MREFNLFVVLTLIVGGITISLKPYTNLVSTSKPNVIIVMTDDQGYGDLRVNGNPIIQTPAIDSFAQESVSLTNYHSGTTCAPTRAGILTGRYSNRSGVWHTIIGASIMHRDETTLADLLKENGYVTGMFGKWHLGDNHPYLPHERGFNYAFYHGGGGVGQTPDFWNNSYFDDTYFRNGIPEKAEGYCTNVWFDNALDFIGKHRYQPFFCYLSLNAPHAPYNVPSEYYSRYRDEDNLQESQKRFYGMITNIDDNFKRLLSHLKLWGLEDNTIVIFTSDNGTANGYFYDKESGEYYGYNAGMRGKKGSQYEGGHRVPFIIKYPNGGLIRGGQLGGLTSHIDVLPTLMSLTRSRFKSDIQYDGIDISGYLKQKESLPNRHIVVDTQREPWPVKGKQSCVMRNDWRLVNGKELYDLKEDPGQKNDLSFKYPEKVVEMSLYYHDWWNDIKDEFEYAAIDIDIDTKNKLTCHDAHSMDSSIPWNQQLIRVGKPMAPAPFKLNFKQSGNYKVELRRWPEESELLLNSANSLRVRPSLSTDGFVKGKSLNIKSAHLFIDDSYYSQGVLSDDRASTFNVKISSGETALVAYFKIEEGEVLNAYYLDITFEGF